MENKKYNILKVKNRLVYSPTYNTRILENYFKIKYIDELISKEPLLKNQSLKDIFRQIKEMFLQVIKISYDLNKKAEIYFLTLDIKKFYSSIDTTILINNVIPKYLSNKAKTYIKYFYNDGFKAGSIIADSIANLYILDIIKELEDNKFSYVRYKDDFLFICKSQEEAFSITNYLENKLREVNLEINKDKVNLRRCTDKSNIFLGFNIYATLSNDILYIKCKKSKLYKIEKRYKEMIGELYKEYQEGENWVGSLKKISNYTLSLINIYGDICSNLNRDFKFINRLLKEVAYTIGAIDKSKEIILNKYEVDTYLYNKVYIKIYMFKISKIIY